MKPIGMSMTVDYFGCDRWIIDNGMDCYDALSRAAVAANLTILQSSCHKFQPQGLSICLLLSESHLSIHTWPERGLVCVDLFSCGTTARPRAILRPLHDAFGASSYAVSLKRRGLS